MNYIFSVLATTISIMILDYVWLGIIMKDFYANRFGALMRPDILYVYAVLFYIIFSIGILYFCIIPHAQDTNFYMVALSGFVFGIMCYMTYDLTNAAMLTNFPTSIIIPDIIWGGIVTASSATIGWWVINIT